jgi:hypothetical protein
MISSSSLLHFSILIFYNFEFFDKDSSIALIPSLPILFFIHSNSLIDLFFSNIFAKNIAPCFPKPHPYKSRFYTDWLKARALERYSIPSS